MPETSSASELQQLQACDAPLKQEKNELKAHETYLFNCTKTEAATSHHNNTNYHKYYFSLLLKFMHCNEKAAASTVE